MELDIHMTLWGHSETKIWADSRCRRLLHSANVELFSRKWTILQESLELRNETTLTVPFGVTFPQTTQANLESLIWKDGAKTTYEGSPEHSLPPSTFARNLCSDRPFLAVVEYFLNTRVSLRHSACMSVHLKCAEPIRVYYEGLNPENQWTPLDTQHHISRMGLGDISLRQRLSKVKGMRAIARSIDLTLPNDGSSIRVVCRIPRRFRIHEPITCVIQLQDLLEQHQSHVNIPEIRLTYASIVLFETMHVRTECLAGDMLESSQQNRLTDMDFIVDPCEPFCANAEYTKTISTGRLKEVPTTFATYNIARSFHALIEIRTESETCSKVHEFQQSIKIYSGFVGQNTNDTAEEVLPSYEEVITQA